MSAPEELWGTWDSHFPRRNTCKRAMRKASASDIRNANFIQILHFYEVKGRLCQRCLECSVRPARPKMTKNTILFEHSSQEVSKTRDFSHIWVDMCEKYSVFDTSWRE